MTPIIIIEDDEKIRNYLSALIAGSGEFDLQASFASAEEAMQYGMVYKIFDNANLLEQTLVNAQAISKMPTKAIGLTKRLLNQSYNNTLEQQLSLEKEMQIKAANSADYKEGVNAFLEKRPANFKGE